MPTLYVRNLPDDLDKRIRSRAARERRSLGAEVIVLLEEALENEAIRERRSQALENIARRRRSMPKSSDSLALLREDRNR
jgi:plasmid stability protein